MAEDALDPRLDELYAAPLDAFVKTRDAIAAELKKAGDKVGAAAVKARPRPSVSAWAVNRLWRVDAKNFEALLAAGSDLREAQRHALSGGGGDRMKRALADRRSAVAKLLARAKEELEAGGHPASASTLHRIESTLHTVATIGERGELGRMAGDVGDDGLEGLLALGASTEVTPAAHPKRHEPEPKKSESKAEHKEHKKEEPKPPRIDPALKKATDRAEAAKASYAAAGESQHEAKRALVVAEKEKAKGRDAVEATKADLKAAEEAVRDARLAVDAAEKRARVTDREADLAARALTESERALERGRVERDAAVESLRALKAES